MILRLRMVLAAQHLAGGLAHLGADAHGKMIGARERPQIAFELLEKFHFDDVFFGRNEIAERHFQIFRAERSGFRKQLISRAGRQHNKI
jgi:hypothetical protein